MVFSTTTENAGVSAVPHSQSAVPDKTTTHYLENGPSYELEADNGVKSDVDMPPILRELTPETLAQMEKKLVRKVDLRLLPMLVLMYIMNYLDRNNIASARLAGKVGMTKELGLTGVEYQTCVSILFVGYILMQVPSNLFLSHIGKPSLFLPTIMIVWGIVSGCSAATHSFGGLVAVRFCLGFVEAAYFPGCLFFLSSWYTRKELALRTAMLYAGSLISGAFSGLIAAGITNGMDGARGLGAWRWLFIIEGAITVVIAFSAYFILPDFPRTTMWLSEEERELAAYRLQQDAGMSDQTGDGIHHGFFHGFTLALADGRMWLLMLLLTGIVSSASITNFFPTVVKTLGYNNIDSLLLTAPPYLLACLTAALNAWHADRTGERFLHIVLPLLVSIFAFILAAATTGTAPRYVAMMLMPASFYPSFVVVLAWISNTLLRPASKRAAGLALINAVSNCTSIFTSYMYQDRMAPRYEVAFGVNCATAVVAVLAAAGLRVVLSRDNKRLERGEKVRDVVAMAGKPFRFLV